MTLQFHPSWPFGDGLVIESMARDGVYRSQFETRTSNGGLTAHPGGDRWRWATRTAARPRHGRARPMPAVSTSGPAR